MRLIPLLDAVLNVSLWLDDLRGGQASRFSMWTYNQIVRLEHRAIRKAKP